MTTLGRITKATIVADQGEWEQFLRPIVEARFERYENVDQLQIVDVFIDDTLHIVVEDPE